ncbi:unnamed protein product [Boreogadus saida]
MRSYFLGGQAGKTCTSPVWALFQAKEDSGLDQLGNQFLNMRTLLNLDSVDKRKELMDYVTPPGGDSFEGRNIRQQSQTLLFTKENKQPRGQGGLTVAPKEITPPLTGAKQHPKIQWVVHTLIYGCNNR